MVSISDCGLDGFKHGRRKTGGMSEGAGARETMQDRVSQKVHVEKWNP